jgi:hypothetical protein
MPTLDTFRSGLLCTFMCFWLLIIWFWIIFYFWKFFWFTIVSYSARMSVNLWMKSSTPCTLMYDSCRRGTLMMNCIFLSYSVLIWAYATACSLISSITLNSIFMNLWHWFILKKVRIVSDLTRSSFCGVFPSILVPFPPFSSWFLGRLWLVNPHRDVWSQPLMLSKSHFAAGISAFRVQRKSFHYFRSSSAPVDS